MFTAEVPSVWDVAGVRNGVREKVRAGPPILAPSLKMWGRAGRISMPHFEFAALSCAQLWHGDPPLSPAIPNP